MELGKKNGHRLEPQLSHPSAVQPGAGQLTSLCFRFPSEEGIQVDEVKFWHIMNFMCFLLKSQTDSWKLVD